MISMVLVFYVLTVPTRVPVNAILVLKNVTSNQRDGANSSLVFSHSMRTSKEIKSPSNKTALTETSAERAEHFLGKNTPAELYHRLKNNPGSHHLDYLKTDIAGKNINLFAPELHPHRVDLLDTLEKIEIQAFEENLSQELKSLEPLYWLTNRTRPTSTLSPLKRRRRQIKNETGEGLELPRFPGAPQQLRQAAKPGRKTSYVKRKILTMMLQSLYSAQERLWPLGPIVSKYEHLTPYRMAFIFMKLDQLVHEGHSIVMYLERQEDNDAMTMTRRLQLYSQLMRRNVDVTYLVDYITERVPRDQVVRMRQWIIRKEQEGIMKQKVAYDATYATRILQRPYP